MPDDTRDFTTTSPEDFLKDDSPRRARARESKFYCDGDQIELLQQEPSESADFAFIQKPDDTLISDWWRAEEITRYYEEFRGQVPSVLNRIGEYPDLRARLLLWGCTLFESARILKPTGSIAVQCDPSEAHHVQTLMDHLLGRTNYQNSLAWDRGLDSAMTVTTRFVQSHDTVLVYRKSSAGLFQQIYRPASLAYTDQFTLIDAEGRRYRRQSLTGKNWGKSIPWTSKKTGITYDPGDRKWAIPRKLLPKELWGACPTVQLDYLDEKGLIIHSTKGGMPDYPQYASDTIDRFGNPVASIWEYHPGTEGTLYKSREAIDQDVEILGGVVGRLLRSMTTEGHRVLLPFCEDEDIVTEACRLERSWVAMGSGSKTLKRVTEALEKYGVTEFQVERHPTSWGEAKELRNADPTRKRCEDYSIKLLTKSIGAKPVGRIRRSSDGGIDATFHLFEEGEQKRIIVSVKSGNTGVRDVRDLVGVLTRESAHFGAYIPWRKPTKDATKEITQINDKKDLSFKIQALSLEGLINRQERLDIPTTWRP